MSHNRGPRLDLLIAVCALLISSLATLASWWQSQESARQTRVLQDQLSAQVWPYISEDESLTDQVVKVSLTNNGLGPAVIRGMSATVDGKPQRTYVDILHAMVGPNIIARSRRADKKIALDLNEFGEGSVLRPGEASAVLTFGSELFARSFLLGYRRMDIRICYCAIIPGKCWRTGPPQEPEPQPLAACAEDRNDLLHDTLLDTTTY